MSKFNTVPTAASSVLGHPAATVNHEGGLAFELDVKTRLYTRVATSLVGEKKFYESGVQHDSALKADIAAVAATDPEFVLRLASYVRHELYLRSVPVLMLVEAARIPACKPFVRQWTPRIITRADQLTEAVAYWINQHGGIGDRQSNGGEHAFPNSLKKGLADAFACFDEYQLAKYDREGTVKLRDVLRVIHPAPAGAARAALYRYLLSGEISEEHLPLLTAKAKFTRKRELDAEARELASVACVTWEVLITQFGGSKESWEVVVPNMGYMAKLRNLRNFLQQRVELEPVLSHLTNAKAIRNSKQLPFRFFAAYREIEKQHGPEVGDVLSALTQALELSTMNLPRLPGTSFIVVDNSGSMDSTLSEKSSVRYADVANLLGAIAHTMCDRAITGSFGTDFALVNVNRADSIMSNMRKFADADTKGMATNAYRCVQWLRERGHRVDRIIILSDMQCYSTHGRNSLAEELLRYRSRVNPRAFVHSVDLAGYGTSQFAPDCPNVMLWAGWSERVLEAIRLSEEDKRQAIARIAEWTAPSRLRADSGDEPLEA